MPHDQESGWERELRERLREIFVGEAAERLMALNSALLALEGGATGSEAAGHLTAAFRQAHTLKGGARAADLPEVAQVAHALESVFDGLRRRGAGAGPGQWAAVYAAVDAVRDLVAGRGADVDGVVAALESTDFDARPAEDAAPPPAPPAEPAPPPPPPAPRTVPSWPGDPAAVGESVRVPLARLDRLMADVRELHAGLAGLRRRAADVPQLDQGASRSGRALQRHLDADVHRIEQAAGELHDHVRHLRMAPVGVALAGLPRLVRDTAAATGKEARLELVGDDTEVDRSVLEGITGAVTHLVRNAVDHGLERPDRRRAAGKPAVGVVTVSAREQRGTLVLEVADDGGGIDVDAMLHRAAEQGLVPAGQDAGPGFDLLFRPGFSTAARVTEVSGRGVGLDAVAAMARGLGGAVALRSEPGQGTTFTVTLPLTLAAIRSLLLRAGGRTLALPLGAVGRVERAGARPVAAELAAVLGLNGTGVPAPPARLAVLSLGDDPTAVLVDEIRGEEEIVVANLPLPLRRVRFTAGATILGTGEVVPVLHAAEVFRAAATPLHRPVVVVADDSPAVRAATQAALESAGYEVRPAADGGEALALVEAGGCDAVVSDVQMPGLDGQELCRRLRADRRFRTLPVVLVTSLAAPDDRRRGLDAGADAYLVKGHSDPTVLLTTLRGLL